MEDSKEPVSVKMEVVDNTDIKFDTNTDFINEFSLTENEIKKAQTNNPTYEPTNYKEQFYFKDDGSLWVNINKQWVNINRSYSATLGDLQSELSLNVVPDKTFLNIQIFVPYSPAPNGNLYIQFNGDTDSNYSHATSVGDNKLDMGFVSTSTAGLIVNMSIGNVAGYNKVACWTGSNATDLVTARLINTGHWDNTTSKITSVRLFSDYNMGIGTSINIL